jgi:hypothetical protein
MNNIQVAKVVYAAQSALDETHGSANQPRWEELTDQQRAELTGDVTSHVSTAEKGIDADAVARNVPGTDKLKYYVTAGIVNGFRQYEAALERQTPTSTTQPQSVKEALAQADQQAAEINASSSSIGPFENQNAPGHELEPSKANTTVPSSASEAK